MAFALKFLRLHQIKHPLTLITSSYYGPISQSRQHFYCKFEPLKTLTNRFRYLTRKHPANCFLNIRSFFVPGSKLNISSIFGASAIFGSIVVWPNVAYAMNGCGTLVDGHHRGTLNASDVEENPPAVWLFVRRFWVPVFFFFTVLINWDHPVILATKVILFLLSTKPSPLSVYVFVEQFCQQYMRQEPHIYGLKSLYASKVEVQDYKLVCLARVDVRDKKFTLVGILGGWWILPLSPGLFSLFRNCAPKGY